MPTAKVAAATDNLQRSTSRKVLSLFIALAMNDAGKNINESVETLMGKKPYLSANRSLDAAVLCGDDCLDPRADILTSSFDEGHLQALPTPPR